MRYLLLLLIALLFISCDNCCISCSEENKKQFVYDVMHDSYLWADETQVLSEQNISDHKDDEALLKTLKHATDRFSHIMTKKEHDDFFEAGVSIGFGFYPIYDLDAENIIPILIYPDSPADRVGLKRGDLIESIDGVKVLDFYNSEKLHKKYFVEDEENLTMTLKLRDQRELTLSKEEFSIKTVLHQSIIDQNSTKIGYLVFQSFIGTSQKELEQSFNIFKEEGITELVLDLRYNGGGYVYIANYLALLIGGDRVEGTIFNQTQYNKKYSDHNKVEYFQQAPQNALNLSRVFIITTQSSCSASELVINALKANSNSVEVIQIGSATCGKPYGMSAISYCDKVILPVQFRSVNGDGEGDYVDGISPLCTSSDDYDKDFGNSGEDSLSSALFYIENNQCKKVDRALKSINKSEILTGFRRMYGIY
jgi:C-terminal processing protease CtpA/Prc